MHRALIAAAALGMVLPGCGAGAPDATRNATKPTQETGSRLVDPTVTPYVNALERRDDGSFLLTTNRGFWEVAADGSQIEQVRGARVVAAEGSSPVGTFLELADVGTGDLIGSGHPDDDSVLPQFLGILRSRDEGPTWAVVDRLGRADIHVVRRVGDTLFLWDAVLGAVLISDQDFDDIQERLTPRTLVLDMVVDPQDPDFLLISTEDEVYRSTDQGRTWRPLAPERAVRMSWTDDGRLFRATLGGAWQESSDRGSSWTDVGELPGEPWKVDSTSAAEHHVALADGSIAATQDGGRTWELLFRAPS